MKNEDIIKNALNFLIKEYGFHYEYKSNGKQVWCKLTNSHGSINWYCYGLFDEYELSITSNKGKKIIDSQFVENKFKIGFSFINLFVDKRVRYWNNISYIFKKQIKERNSLFGLIVKHI